MAIGIRSNVLNEANAPLPCRWILEAETLKSEWRSCIRGVGGAFEVATWLKKAFIWYLVFLNSLADHRRKAC